MRRIVLALAFLLALPLAGCTEAGPFVPDIATANFAPSLGVDIPASTRTSSGLYYRDITVGAGTLRPTTAGSKATTAYALYLRTGTLIQEGSFQFSPGEVIAGYDEGVTGMRVGGVRQLIIPPSLGYGANRNGSIPPNSILVYTVTLTSVP